MKRILSMVLIIVFLFGTCTTFATSDKALVKKYCDKHYKGYKIVYMTKWNEKTILHRKGKSIVYVEVMTSKSRGTYGYTKEGYYIKYNKKVTKGKTVKSYCIYNPYTNYCDDVVAVVDNKKIR